MQVIEPILRKHEYGVLGSALMYMPARDLSAVLKYLTDLPRTTEIGFPMTEKDAARIIGGTIRSRGNISLAMQFDCLDNQFNKIATSLRNAGVSLTGSLIPSEPEDILRFKALLHAENVVFERFNYHPASKTDALQVLYRYVEENPAQAYRIMEIANQRYSLDTEMIKEVLGSESPALGMGTL
jgi:hypothetical protein